MKKLFISQPMKGKTDKEILQIREMAIKSAIEYECAIAYGIRVLTS